MRRQGYFRQLTRRLDADPALLQPPRSLVRRWEADDIARVVPRAPARTDAGPPPAPLTVEPQRLKVTVEQPVPQSPWREQPRGPLSQPAEPIAHEEVPPPADEPPPVRALPEVVAPPVTTRSEPAAPAPVDLVPAPTKIAAEEPLDGVVRERAVDTPAPVAVARAKPLSAEPRPLQPIPPVAPRPVFEPKQRPANSVRMRQPEQDRRLDPVRRRPDVPDKPVRRRTVDNARAAESAPAIYIDTIEVKVEPPVVPLPAVAPPPPQRKPADTLPAPTRLARGFATTIGMRQA